MSKIVCGSERCSKQLNDKENSVECNGVCGKAFHTTCVGMDRIYSKYGCVKNLLWFCDSCVVIHLSMDKKVNKLRRDFLNFADDNKKMINLLSDKIELLSKNSEGHADKIVETINTREATNSYAAITKGKSVVVVKAKNSDQTVEQTRDKLKNTVKPSSSISGMRLNPNVNLIISCENVKKLNFGWNRCRVYDAMDVMRCFRCCGYHPVNECKEKELVCYLCSGAHKSAECPSKDNRKCINCVNANTSLHLHLNVEHSAMSRECPVYKRKLNDKKKYINYKH